MKDNKTLAHIYQLSTTPHENCAAPFYCVVFATSLFAQHAQIKGTITDTINKQKLEYASVLLLHKKDSVLYQFTRSNAEGNFTFHKADTGKYIFSFRKTLMPIM